LAKVLLSRPRDDPVTDAHENGAALEFVVYGRNQFPSAQRAEAGDDDGGGHHVRVDDVGPGAAQQRQDSHRRRAERGEVAAQADPEMLDPVPGEQVIEVAARAAHEDLVAEISLRAGEVDDRADMAVGPHGVVEDVQNPQRTIAVRDLHHY
jgi:hypothetical protein